MATQVYRQSEIVLWDGVEVIVKPLPIGRLRRFMEAWDQTKNIPEGEDGFDVFINCAGIALEHNFTGQYQLKATAAEKESGEFLGQDYKDYLLDTLDLDTIYEILDVAGGIKLNDPKLLEAAEKAMREQQEA